MDQMKDSAPGTEKTGKSWLGFLKRLQPQPKPSLTPQQQEAINHQMRKDRAILHAVEHKLALERAKTGKR